MHSLEFFCSRLSQCPFKVSISKSLESYPPNGYIDGSFNDVECDYDSENHRSYRADETILVDCEGEILTVSVESLQIYYNTPSGEIGVYSLQSALTDGCLNLHKDDSIRFVAKIGKDEESNFLLPLVSHDDKYNLVPERLYFYCIDNVKNALVMIETSNNRILQVHCTSNVLIFHSEQDSVNIRINEREYRNLRAYHQVVSEAVPQSIQSSHQNTVTLMQEIIADGIPVLFEGASGCGKTFAVHYYCQLAQLPVVTYYGSVSSSVEDLIAFEVFDSSAEAPVLLQGSFMDAFVRGKVFLLEAVSFLPISLLRRILKAVTQQELNGRRMHPNFRLLVTHNSDDGILSPPIYDCFKVIDMNSHPLHQFDRDGLLSLFENEEYVDRILSIPSDYHTCRNALYIKKLLGVIESYKVSDPLAHALQIVCGLNMNAEPILQSEIQFALAPLDRECWKEVYNRFQLAFKAKCNILLVGESEWTARKYCMALLNTNYAIHCTSACSTEQLLGKNIIHPGESTWFSSSLLIDEAENGGSCILYSIHSLRKSVACGLNQFMESHLSVTAQTVHLDKRLEKMDFQIQDGFQVIATTSEEGLISLLPSLRSRFLVIHIGQEEETRLERSPSLDEYEMDRFNDYPLLEEIPDYFEKKKAYNTLMWVDKALNMELNEETVQLLLHESPLSAFEKIQNQPEQVCQLFYSLSRNRATVLCGPRASGKTHSISLLLQYLKYSNHETFYISKTTDMTALLGSVDSNGHTHERLLMEAMENGKLVIFENAENMSSELLEELDSILDPLTNQYSGVIKSCSIHPLFRVLFVVSETSPSSLSFPSYVQCVRMNALTVDFITSHIDTFSTQSNGRELIRRLCTHVPSRISLQEIMMLSVLFYSTDPFKVIVGLYADREDRRDLILDVIRDWRENDSSLQSELDHVVNSIQTSAVTVKKCGNTDGSEITRGNYNTILSVPYSTLENVDPSVLRCLFSIGTSGWKRAESPILLIGDSDVISEVTQLLFPKSVHVVVTPNTTFSNIVGDGETTIGPMLTASRINNSSPIILHNLENANERFRSQLYALLLNKSLGSSLENIGLDQSVESTTFNGIVSTCAPQRLSLIGQREQFLQIYCPPYSDEKRKAYGFECCENLPISLLDKAKILEEGFRNPKKIVPCYVECIESEYANRLELLENYSESEELKPLYSYFTTEPLLELSLLSELFSEEIAVHIQNSIDSLYPLRTTIQMLASITLCYVYHIPLLLEGKPRVGKRSLVEQYCSKNGLAFQPFYFSESVSEEAFYSFLSEERKGKTVLYLEQIDHASSDLQEVFSTLFQCVRRKAPIPLFNHELYLSEDILIVCSSTNHCLPPSLYESCICHCGIQFTQSEVSLLAQNWLNNETAVDFLQQHGSLTISDVIKIRELLDNKVNPIQALWLTLICPYENSKSATTQRALKLPDTLEVTIQKYADHCVIAGYWLIDTKCQYAPDFKEWCFTSTERATLFRLCVALQSSFPLLLTGMSPGGRMFVVSNLAKLWNRTLIIITLDETTTVDDLIGDTWTHDFDWTSSSHRSSLLRAMEEGYWVLIQGLDKAIPEVLSVIALICEGYSISEMIAEGNNYVSPTNRSRISNPSFRLFLCAQSQQSLRYDLSQTCMCIHCDPIATLRDVQEICSIRSSTRNPRLFGPEEIKHFYKCLYVINSTQSEAFSHLFNKEPILHTLCNPIETIPHSIEYEFQCLKECDDVETSIIQLPSLLKKLLAACDMEFADLLPIIVHFKQQCNKHYLFFVLDAIEKTIPSIQNGCILDQGGESVQLLHRWLSLSDSSLTSLMNLRPSDRCDLLHSPEMPIEEAFLPSVGELLRLLFICNRVDEIRAYLHCEKLTQFLLQSFTLLDQMKRIDVTEQVLYTIELIYMEYKKMARFQEEGVLESLYRSDHHVGSFYRIEDAVSNLPQELKSNPNLISIMKDMIENRRVIRRQFMEQEGSNAETRQYYNEVALEKSSSSDLLQTHLKSAFNGSIDLPLFEAFQWNVEERDYRIYAYSSEENKLIVQTSHFIYKLQHFHNYVFLLSEYSDVLKVIEIDIIDVLREFTAVQFLLPHILTLLNALLKREMKSMKWTNLLHDYCQYPFVMPVEVTKESVAEAIRQLIRRGWYGSYARLHATLDSEAMCSQLTSVIYDESKIQPIHLDSPLFLKTIEDCNDLSHVTYQQVKCVDMNWVHDYSSEVGEGITIPSAVLVMENTLLQVTTDRDELMEIVWNDSQLKNPEKLKVVCPRTQTLLGSIVMDTLKEPDLKEAMISALQQNEELNGLFSSLVEIMSAKSDEIMRQHKEELAQIENDFQRAEKSLDESKQKATQEKAIIMGECEKWVAEKNSQFPVIDKTVRMLCYMAAVNNLQEEEISSYLNGKRLISRKLSVAFTVHEEYRPFDMQLIWFEKKAACEKIVIHPPNGLSPYTQDFTFDGISKLLKNCPSYNNGYLFVLPYAPFNWNCELSMQTGLHKVYYYTNNKTHLQKIPSRQTVFKCGVNVEMLDLLLCLHAMTFIKASSGFSYNVVSVSEDQLKDYDFNKYAGEEEYGRIYYESGRFHLFASGSSEFSVDCRIINRGDDIMDIPLENGKIKCSWRVEDCISTEGDFESIVVHNEEDMKMILNNVKVYNDELPVISTKIKEKEREEERKVEKERIIDQLPEKDFYYKFFFPPTEQSYSTTLSLSLHDVIIVFYDGHDVSLGLPSGNEFYLPNNILYKDSSDFWMPIILTHKLLDIKITSSDCEVIQKYNGCTFKMKNMQLGENRVRLVANVTHRGNSHISLSEEFSFVFNHQVEKGGSSSVQNDIIVKMNSFSDSQHCLDALRSQNVSIFAESLSGVLNYILCANKEDQQEIIKILLSITPSTSLFSSIKAEAERVLTMIEQYRAMKWIQRPASSTKVNAIEYSYQMDQLGLNELFNSLYHRREVKDIVVSSDSSMTLSTVELTPNDYPLSGRIMHVINSHAAKLAVKLSISMNMNCRSAAYIVLDTSCSIRNRKLRLRSILASILISLCAEFGIEYHLIVACGRNRAVEVKCPSRTASDMIAFIFDIEYVAKMPSFPLDILFSRSMLHEDDIIFLLSDGFSEQLRSPLPEIRQLIQDYKNLYLLYLRGTGEEELEGGNNKLDEILKDNFSERLWTVESDGDLDKYHQSLKSLLFTTTPKTPVESEQVSQASNQAVVWKEDFSHQWSLSKSMVLCQYIPFSTPLAPISIQSDELHFQPSESSNTLLHSLESTVPSDNLIDAFQQTLFIPTPAISVLTSTGISVSLSKVGRRKMNNKVKNLFYRSLPEIPHHYAVSIVIDCSAQAFSRLNRNHSLLTTFSILRNISQMSIQCVDVWIASSDSIRVATGISSQELWSERVLGPIYHSTLNPASSTVLPHCMQYASCTCAARKHSAVMLVLTNGVVVESSRNRIQEVIHSVDLRYVGIGIGSYLCGFDSYLPEMVWNSNPFQLGESLKRLSLPDSYPVRDGVEEEAADAHLLLEDHPVHFDSVLREVMQVGSNDLVLL